MKLAIIGIVLLILTFSIGWLMPEVYPIESFADGRSHALGLKFMPPCKPFGSIDATCGLDSLLLIFFLFCVVLIIIDIGETEN